MCEITSVEDIRDAIGGLSPEDRAQLMPEVVPQLCHEVLNNPELLKQMLPRCEEMMRDPKVQKAMCPIMERMFTSMMGPNR